MKSIFPSESLFFEVPLPLAVKQHEYVELYRGIGIDYEETIVNRKDLAAELMSGWSITRLSKVAPKDVYKKWKATIDYLERK